jgi:hypothetical protein
MLKNRVLRPELALLWRIVRPSEPENSLSINTEKKPKLSLCGPGRHLTQALLNKKSAEQKSLFRALFSEH